MEGRWKATAGAIAAERRTVGITDEEIEEERRQRELEREDREDRWNNPSKPERERIIPHNPNRNGGQTNDEEDDD